MEVTVRAERVEVSDRRLYFRVQAWDEVERVIEAEHERFIIDAYRFQRRLDEKQPPASHTE